MRWSHSSPVYCIQRGARRFSPARKSIVAPTQTATETAKLFRNDEPEQTGFAQRCDVIGAEFAAPIDIDRLFAKPRQDSFDQSSALALGLCPTTPLKKAGSRIDPPMSPPRPMGEPPAPMIAPSPPEEPPGEWRVEYAFVVRPYTLL